MGWDDYFLMLFQNVVDEGEQSDKFYDNFDDVICVIITDDVIIKTFFKPHIQFLSCLNGGYGYV